MTGPIDAGVQITTGFMDSLKKEPLSLALVVMNLCLLLFFYVILVRVADQRKEEIGLLYADKKDVRDLLAKCVVPERRSDIKMHDVTTAVRWPDVTVLPPPKEDE